ncbi:MAG: glycosyltransferase family 9 protein [Arenicellales bacterium]|nr:glycosyltransferase family 9 protein [Arenicellales bacterium]
MNILLIKQTSLGDVLHATGHIRRVREYYPDAHLTLLTSVSAADLFHYNPHIDELISFDRYWIKYQWFRHPIACLRHVLETMTKVRQRNYDLAIDLQGRWKTVLFLWGARAKRRVVKGRWWFATRFHQPELHALRELDGVLEVAGLPSADSQMEIHLSAKEVKFVNNQLARAGITNKRLVVFSPLSRWPTKDWALQRYRELCDVLPADCAVVVTGTEDERSVMSTYLTGLAAPQVVNLAGQLSLLELAELMGRAAAVVCGDSFPMHVAVACNVPVVALFAPTDERRVGPLSSDSIVIRPEQGCDRCYRRRHCSNQCMARIEVSKVAAVVKQVLRVA